MIQRQTLHLEIASENAELFERRAREMNLTPAAFFQYLLLRHESGDDAERLERHVREVFGRYGKTMRKLAE